MHKNKLFLSSAAALTAVLALAPTITQAATISLSGNADGRKTVATPYKIQIEPRLTDKNGDVVTPKGGTYVVKQVKKVMSDGSEVDIDGTPATITLDANENTINVPEDGVYQVTPGDRIPGYHKDKGYLEGGQYKAYQYTFPTQNTANTEFYNADTQTIRMVPKLTPVNGEIRFVKHGDDGQPLAGVTFSIEQLTDAKTQTSKEAGDLQNGVSKTVTTTADGVVKFDNLPEGTYKVVETKAVEGYAIDSREVLFEVTLDENDALKVTETTAEKILTQAQEFLNFKQPNVDKKVKTHNLEQFVDATSADGGEALTNIDRVVNFEFNVDVPRDIDTYKEYTITDELDEKFDISTLDKSKVTVETDGAAAEGTVSLDGRTLKIDFTEAQRKALKGKQKVRIAFGIKLDASKVSSDTEINNMVELSWDNNHGASGKPKDTVVIQSKEGNLEITKRASKADGDALPNAKFKLWRVARDGEQGQTVAGKENLVLATDSTGVVVGDNLTSDAQGKIVVKRLPFGEYFIQEVEAPVGYRLNQNLKAVTIGDTDTTIEADGQQLMDGVKENIINYKESEWFPATGTLGISVAVAAFGGLAVTAGWLQKKKKEVSK